MAERGCWAPAHLRVGRDPQPGPRGVHQAVHRLHCSPLPRAHSTERCALYTLDSQRQMPLSMARGSPLPGLGFLSLVCLQGTLTANQGGPPGLRVSKGTTSRQKNQRYPSKSESKWSRRIRHSSNMVVHASRLGTAALQNFHRYKVSISKYQSIPADAHLNDSGPLEENLGGEVLHDDVLQQLAGVPDQGVVAAAERAASTGRFRRSFRVPDPENLAA